MRRFLVAKGFNEKEVIIPKRQTAGSAGYDFSVLKDTDILPHETKLISTGVKACMNEGEVLKLYARSSLAKKKGLFIANHVGIIDSDYFENDDNDGHIMINVYNFTDKTVKVLKGERIAQGIFQQYLTVDDDTCCGSRNGGFGSTSK